MEWHQQYSILQLATRAEHWLNDVYFHQPFSGAKHVTMLARILLIKSDSKKKYVCISI